MHKPNRKAKVTSKPEAKIKPITDPPDLLIYHLSRCVAKLYSEYERKYFESDPAECWVEAERARDYLFEIGAYGPLNTDPVGEDEYSEEEQEAAIEGTTGTFLRCANRMCRSSLKVDHVTLVTTGHVRRFCGVECITEGQEANIKQVTKFDRFCELYDDKEM